MAVYLWWQLFFDAKLEALLSVSSEAVYEPRRELKGG